jgi:uncharacterized membrane protein
MPVPTPESIFNVLNTESDIEYDAYEKDIAIAHFYFDSSTIFRYHREQRLTIVGFISQIGGVLGLCIGFSIVSVVELAYWFLYRLVASVTSPTKPQSQKSPKLKSSSYYGRYKKKSTL